MNCGINDGGWRPPKITVDEIVFEDLSSAVEDHNSPFHACTKFVPIFNKYGDQFGRKKIISFVDLAKNLCCSTVPPILLASFAMQESSCIPETVGAGGEQGLMQITREKCLGATNEDCRNPVGIDISHGCQRVLKYISYQDFNIGMGARYFAETLKNNGGDLLLSIGMYNGYQRGLTFVRLCSRLPTPNLKLTMKKGQATAAAKSDCCLCQNNLD
jgi:hypothetical protein